MLAYTQAQASTIVVTDNFRLRFNEVSKEIYEVDPAEMRRTVEGVEDFSRTERAREEMSLMNAVPPEEEVIQEMGAVKELVSAEDGL